MLKPIMIMYPVIPARDEEERAALRPIGRHRERYHDAIHGMTEIIQAADEMGFWGAATPEHHFWSEGYEVAPSPGATNAYWLAKTKNIHIGPLGYVMSTHNPIRVAEEVAVIDHLSKGPHLRGLRARLSVALDQHLRPAFRHARNQVARRRGLQCTDRAGRLLAGDTAPEGPRRRCA